MSLFRRVRKQPAEVAIQTESHYHTVFPNIGTHDEVKELLCKQLQLLAEKSKDDDIDTESLIRLSGEIDRIANTILRERQAYSIAQMVVGDRDGEK